MKKVLVVQSSPLGENSITRKLTAKLEQKILEKYSNVEFVVRDLVETPVPHLNMATLASFQNMSVGGESSIDFSNQLIKEVKQSDAVIIAAPMWNFGVPSVLKAWVDHIARAGQTFNYSEKGPEGLLENIKVFAVLSSGSVFSEGPMKSLDFVSPYLQTVMSFMGLDDFVTIRAEGVAIPELTEAALYKAYKQIESLQI